MKTAHDLVADAKARIHEVTPDEAEASLADIDLVIDVREPDEFREDHLPGAVNIPRGMLEFKLTADPALEDRSRRVLVYCKTSGRAALSAVAMQEMGYLHVASIAGGIDAWREAGKTLVKPALPDFE
ncbi:MAG TPA: sulfurtransferase [Halieaceae bacterium]|nr:sulfurtransferase [Halieaceae bacterium]